MSDPPFLRTLIGDGRPLLVLVALILIGAGFFAIGTAATGHFLPHDTAFLGMSAEQLCSLHGCRIVHFMIHDRVSFGGVLVAIGVMYLWLAEFPLKRGERWAWWTFVISGGAGFLSFLAYLGYGYLDTWHGGATLVLLPLYLGGLWMTRGGRRAQGAGGSGTAGNLDLLRPAPSAQRPVASKLLVAATAGIVLAGVTITTVGITTVFVPQDLAFMNVTTAELRAINDRLVPLIAHDRAGFGGALLSAGLAMLLSVWFSPLARSLRGALAIAGVAGFSTAIGVHPVIGYTDPTHLGPAILGALVFFTGLTMASLRVNVPATDAV